MFIKRSPLYVAFLFILWPAVSIGGSFPFQKRSNLPCLAGNPEFSEILIANNQYLSGKRYAIKDALLWDGLLNVKRSMGPVSTAEIKNTQMPHLQGFSEFGNYVSQQIQSAGKLGALLEFGIYFNRLSMLYVSLFDRFAFVVGDDSKPFNVHLSLGNFPIHFGSGFSEYSLANPLQSDMGVAKNTRAGSLNGEYYWNFEHKTKGRVFAFMPYFPLQDDYINYEWGLNLHHEWKLSAKSIVDCMHAGFSWVSGLPFATLGSEHPDGFDIYMHVNSGSVKFKLESVIGDSLKWKKKWFGQKKRRVAGSRRAASEAGTYRSSQRGRSSSVGNRSESRRPSRARSKIRAVSTNPGKEDISILNLPYVVHGEVAYKLPIKRDVTAVAGYAWGGSEFLSASARGFLGVKVSLLENMSCLIGYQGEKDLKVKRKGELVKGAVPLKQDKIFSDNESVTTKNKRHYDEWRHSLTIQLNVSL